LSHFNLKIQHDEAYALTRSEFISKRNANKDGEILDIIIEKYKALEDRNDFMLVEGTDFSGEGTAIELDANILIAQNLGLPTIIVSSGIGKSLDEFINGLNLAYDSFDEKGVKVSAVIANKVQKENIEKIINGVEKKLPKNVVVNAIPLIPNLKNPTLREIVKSVDAKVLFGEEFLNNQSNSFTVGAMQLRNYLTHLEEDCLVITPGDRADIILGALQANISSKYPKISGIVLSGGLIPEEPIIKLIEGLQSIIPILSVEENTFEVANKIGDMRSHMYADNEAKILLSLNTFDEYCDVDRLSDKLVTFKHKGMTPRMFQYNLLKRAKTQRKHIVLPEGSDDRIITAASRLAMMDFVVLNPFGT